MLLMKNSQALLVGLLFSMLPLFAHNKDDIRGAVFSATNPVPVDAQGNTQFNGVMMYHRHADGTLTLVPGSPFLTEGLGVGPGNFPPNDSLGAQNSLVVDAKKKFVFVVDAGSNEISVFKIHRDCLRHIQTVSSGGTFPNSIAVRDDVLYVLNSGGVANFVGFKICKDGHLKRLNSQPCFLQSPLNVWPIGENGQPQVTAIPSDIGFSPDGRHLLIIRKEGFLCPDPKFPGFECVQNVAGVGRIDIYALDKKLRVIDCENPVSTINARAPAGRMPFAFSFTKEGKLLVAEFLGTAESATTIFGVSAVSSYTLKKDGTLELISADVGNGQTGACWIRNAGRFAYTSNEESSSISQYRVEKNGTLTLVNGQAAFLGEQTPPGFVLDNAITEDGQFLYQLVPSNALIFAFKINQADGSLAQIGSVAMATPFSGQSGLATVDFTCK